MKTKEELKVLKEEIKTLNKKLAELTDEELEQVTGGTFAECLACPHYGDGLTCLKGFGGGRCPKFAELTNTEVGLVLNGEDEIGVFKTESHPQSVPQDQNYIG